MVKIDGLNNAQETQVKMQLENHEHDDYGVDIVLAPGHILEGFIVKNGVFRPDITSAVYLARWLFFNNCGYQDKAVFDCGCGTGLQGITAAKHGAMYVTSADISDLAVSNTWENIHKYNLEQKMDAKISNLFEKIEGTYNYIIFNHPFFPGNPIEEKPISKAMLGGNELIHRFLAEAHSHLENNGKIVMPYFHLAGDVNNPAIQGPKHNYKVIEKFSTTIGNGLQQGRFSIYEIRRCMALHE